MNYSHSEALIFLFRQENSSNIGNNSLIWKIMKTWNIFVRLPEVNDRNRKIRSPRRFQWFLRKLLTGFGRTKQWHLVTGSSKTNEWALDKSNCKPTQWYYIQCRSVVLYFAFLLKFFSKYNNDHDLWVFLQTGNFYWKDISPACDSMLCLSCILIVQFFSIIVMSFMKTRENKFKWPVLRFLGVVHSFIKCMRKFNAYNKMFWRRYAAILFNLKI